MGNDDSINIYIALGTGEAARELIKSIDAIARNRDPRGLQLRRFRIWQCTQEVYGPIRSELIERIWKRLVKSGVSQTRGSRSN